MSSENLPDHSADNEIHYSLEIVAELAGLSPQTVLHYQELALISPVGGSAPQQPEFDVESLRQLRRIEHLRHVHEVNDTALKFILSLLDEVENLRQELRRARR